MSKSVRRFLSFLLVLQLIIPYSTFAAAVGEFTSVVGEVTQTRAKEVITPVAKSPIELKDLIATDRNSSTSMVFSDDSTIMLSENTKLEIKEFLFKEKSRTGIFSLAIGKVTAAVNKFIGGDNVFEVHSPTAVVGVRGTGFEFIESKVGDATTATVICTEGSLTISALSAAGVIISTSIIVAGQTAVISGGIITVSATIAGAAAAAGAGLSTAGAGLSTGAIIGITAGAIAVTGGVAVAANRSSSDSSSGSGSGSTPSPQVLTTQTIVGTFNISGGYPGVTTMSGTWTFNSNGSFSNSLVERWIATNQTAPYNGSGSWTLNGTTMNLNDSIGGAFSGTASGNSNSFTLNRSDGYVLNFSR